NTSMTVLLVVLALVVFGGESIRQFNIALLFGIAIGTYSSIFVASPLVVLLEQKLVASEAAAAQQSERRRQDVSLQGARNRPAAAALSTGSATVRTNVPAASSSTGSSSDSETAGRAKPGVATVRPKRKRRQ
ncbi:MAG: hypothetical protein FJX77_06815, partial [Armatimonadetes bacterium]|nr:hypothetical protein [Armatimonadota bacterium]